MGKLFCQADGENGECVDKSKICDGVRDCENGRDEAHCGMSSILINAFWCSFPQKLRTCIVIRTDVQNANYALPTYYLRQIMT